MTSSTSLAWISPVATITVGTIGILVPLFVNGIIGRTAAITGSVITLVVAALLVLFGLGLIDITVAMVGIGITLFLLIAWVLVSRWREKPPVVFVGYSKEDREEFPSLQASLNNFQERQEIQLRYREDHSDLAKWRTETEEVLKQSRAAIILFPPNHIDTSKAHDSVIQEECFLIHQRWRNGKLKVFSFIPPSIQERETPDWTQWLWSADISPTGEINHIRDGIREVVRRVLVLRVIHVALILMVPLFGALVLLSWDGWKFTSPSFGIFARDQHDVTILLESERIDGGTLYRGARDSVRNEKTGAWEEEESLTTKLLRKIHNLKVGMDAATRGGGPIIGAVDLEKAFDLIGTPRREITLRTFDIDEYEVTNAQYRAFLEDPRRNSRRYAYNNPDRPEENEPNDHNRKPSIWSTGVKLSNGITVDKPDQPVVHVSFYGAYAYCHAQGKRLPTENEWEAAARGEENWPYPWGERFDERFYENNNGKRKGPQAVKSLDAPREGAPRGMATNVGEWTSTDHPDGGKIIKGSAWTQNDGEVYALAFVRHPGKSLDSGGIEAGFRCARGVANENDPTPEGMVRVSGGEYRLGGDDSPVIKLIRALRGKYANAVEAVLREPAVTEEIDTFFLDKYEVTNGDYLAFIDYVEETGNRWMDHPDQPEGKDHKSDYRDNPRFNDDDQPVVGVDWYDAYAFCRRADRRLPTTSEWEYATRWNRENPYSLYPWGNEFEETKDVFGESPLFWPVKANAPPGGDGAIAHLAGNVEEWTARDVDGSKPHKVENGKKYQLIKGGNWKESGLVKALVFQRATAAAREYRGNETGFRCAKSDNAVAGR